MNFRPELVEKILAGEKTQTRRRMSGKPRSPWYRGGCALKVNHAYALCPGRGKHQVGKLVVTTVRDVRLGDISEAEARAEGFDDVVEFAFAWEAINGVCNFDERVWAITFHLMPPGDGPLWLGGVS